MNISHRKWQQPTQSEFVFVNYIYFSFRFDSEEFPITQIQCSNYSVMTFVDRQSFFLPPFFLSFFLCFWRVAVAVSSILVLVVSLA